MFKVFILAPTILALSVMAGFAIYIYLKNPYNPLNRTFILFLAFASLWAVSEVLVDAASREEWALVWLKLSAIGWIFMAPIFLSFILLLTRRAELLSRFSVLFLLFAPALVFLYLTWKTPFILTHDVFRVGAFWDVPNGRYFWIFAAWLAFLYSLILFLLFRFIRKSKITDEERRVQSVLLAISVPFSIIFVASLLPSIGGISGYKQFIFEQISIPLTALVLVFFLSYAIIKYKLFIVSPSVALSSIIATMNEALIVFNPDGYIEIVNPAASRLLGYREDELVGSHVKKVFPTGRAWDAFFWDAFVRSPKHKSVQGLETVLVAKNKEPLPVGISFSVMQGRPSLGPIGMVILANDIREYKILQRQLEGTLEDLKEVGERLEKKLGKFPGPPKR